MGRTGAMENLVKAHSSSIEGIQTAGNFLFTIGMGERCVFSASSFYN